MERLDSDLLRSFVAVADCENLTLAAEGLGRTQSAISVQIKKLEMVLACKLFERKARGMVLSEEGRTLLGPARAIIGELDRVAGLFSPPLQGRVRVGIPADYGRVLLEGILSQFHRQHPEVEIEVRCENSVAFPARIDEGTLDLAVHVHRAGETCGTPLRREESVWVAAQTWVNRPDVPLPLAVFDRACWWRDAVLDALQEHQHAYRIVVTSESTAGVVAAISAGLAVGMLSRGVVGEGMRILGERDGLPALPKTTLSLLASSKQQKACVTAMATAIRRGFHKVQDSPRSN